MFIVDKKIRCWCPSVAFGITIILYRGNQVANGQPRRSWSQYFKFSVRFSILYLPCN